MAILDDLRDFGLTASLANTSAAAVVNATDWATIDTLTNYLGATIGNDFNTQGDILLKCTLTSAVLAGAASAGTLTVTLRQTSTATASGIKAGSVIATATKAYGTASSASLAIGTTIAEFAVPRGVLAKKYLGVCFSPSTTLSAAAAKIASRLELGTE